MNGAEALRIARFLFADSGIAAADRSFRDRPLFAGRRSRMQVPAVARFRESRFFVKFEGF